MKPDFSVCYVFFLLTSVSAQRKPSRHGNADRGGAIHCFTGQKITGENLNQNFMTLQTCAPRSSCNTMNADISMTVAGQTITANMVVGQCTPTDSCRSVTCAQIQRFTQAALASSVPSATFGTCSINCCDSDRCNAELAGESATTDVTPSPPIRPAGGSSDCPGNQVYSTCAGCFTTCEERDRPKICTLQCRQQCTCPPNTFLNGDMCLTAEECDSAGENAVSESAIRCYAGQKITGGRINQNMQTLQTCVEGSSCSTVDMSITISMGTQSVGADVSVGQCLPTIACATLNCGQIQRGTEAAFAELFPSATFGDCSISCCHTDRCNGPGGDEAPSANSTTPAAPVVPAVGTACNPPMWNAEIRDNWPLAGRTKKSKASFQLIVKGVKKGYKAGRTYKVLIKTAKKSKSKFNGFMVTLHHEPGNCACPDQECGLGALIGSRRRIAGAPVVQPGCDQPLVMDYPSANANKAQAEWRAPSCGNVVMRVLVKGTDGRLYQDNEEDDQEHQILTRILRPKQKKGGRKPKRGRGH